MLECQKSSKEDVHFKNGRKARFHHTEQEHLAEYIGAQFTYGLEDGEKRAKWRSSLDKWTYY